MIKIYSEMQKAIFHARMARQQKRGQSRKSEAVRLRNGVQHKNKLIQQRKQFFSSLPSVFHCVFCHPLQKCNWRSPKLLSRCASRHSYAWTAGAELARRNCYISWFFSLSTLPFFRLKLNLFVKLLLLRPWHFIFICERSSNKFSNPEMKNVMKKHL